VSADNRAGLDAAYSGDGGTLGVFSTKVADYLASRPHYPAALFDALHEIGVLAPGMVVADLGAGTGLLTRDLLARGCTVHAVEPNAEMRRAADALLGGESGYASVEGTAEATSLPDARVDLVTAAQAFHWFDVDAARAECLRILRRAGQVALIWNDRLQGDRLHAAIDELFTRFGGEKKAALTAHEDRARAARFFGASAYRTIELPNAHRLDAAGFEALLFSRSYMPARASEAGRAVRAGAAAAFETFAEGREVIVRYRTVAIVGRPGG